MGSCVVRGGFVRLTVSKVQAITYAFCNSARGKFLLQYSAMRTQPKIERRQVEYRSQIAKAIARCGGRRKVALFYGWKIDLAT